jgi:putative ABC transport system ATP-binding protein
MNMPRIPAAVPLLEVAGLAKRYGDAPVFTDVSLVMQRGELVALLGESGVG